MSKLTFFSTSISGRGLARKKNRRMSRTSTQHLLLTLQTFFRVFFFLLLTSSKACALDLLDALFPPGYAYTSSFSAASLQLSSTNSSKTINANTNGTDATTFPSASLTLNATSLNIVHGTPPLPSPFANKATWRAIYPEGAYSGNANVREGWSFYVNGSDAFADQTASGAKEVVVGYSVYFEEGFGFQLGGKLPGACE